MLRIILFLVATLAVAAVAVAQPLPHEPVTFGGGRFVIGGDVAVAIAPEDDGFFNYSDYEQTTIRLFRVGVSGSVRITERIAILGELRSENLEHVTPLALYARIRPFAGRRVDIQIGRIPPTVGGLSRRTYGHDNPLVGTPLAYQYLTSLRADAAPADADELLRMRGRGWLSSFSIGDAEPRRGVPLVSGTTWDTGVQVTTGWRFATVAAAVTSGTASNPRVTDDNGGKQVAARVSLAPVTGLVIGGSYARGEFLNRRVSSLLQTDGDRRADQRVRGVDVEYSRGHWIARADIVLSQWRMPLGGRLQPLRASAAGVEGRYTIRPGLYAAVRAEHLGFNRITGAQRTDRWDAPVTRIEVGGGYYLQRNLVARLALQSNERDGGRIRSARFLTAQVLYWF